MLMTPKFALTARNGDCAFKDNCFYLGQPKSNDVHLCTYVHTFFFFFLNICTYVAWLVMTKYAVEKKYPLTITICRKFNDLVKESFWKLEYILTLTLNWPSVLGNRQLYKNYLKTAFTLSKISMHGYGDWQVFRSYLGRT
jgi:hypothetical protein